MGWKCIDGTKEEIERDACDSWTNLECSMGNVIGISLSSTELTGYIPSSVGLMTKLRYLHLDGNNFQGTIPTLLGDLARINHLTLSNNQLSGSIPSELSKLKNLKSLYLSHNRLTGTLPPSLSSIQKIEIFAVSNNSITGSIPDSYAVFVDRTLEFHENHLTGVIPVELCNAYNMYTFHNRDLINECSVFCAATGECDPEGIYHDKYHGKLL